MIKIPVEQLSHCFIQIFLCAESRVWSVEAWAIVLLINVLNTNKVGLNVLHKYVNVSSNCLINLEQGILTNTMDGITDFILAQLKRVFLQWIPQIVIALVINDAFTDFPGILNEEIWSLWFRNCTVAHHVAFVSGIGHNRPFNCVFEEGMVFYVASARLFCC